MTPLMYAAATDHGDIEIARLLMARGADLNVKSNAGETALDWANKIGTDAAGGAAEEGGRRQPRLVPPRLPSPAPAPTEPRLAIERGVALLERSSGTFFTNGGCGSCHAQNITDIAVAAARKRGIPVSEAGGRPARGRRVGDVRARPRRGSTSASTVPSIDILLYTLAGFARRCYPPIAPRTRSSSIWRRSSGATAAGMAAAIPRPPIEDGDFTRTALAIRALTSYAPPGRMP